MASTIVIELGSSRIKVGFAGEPRPRRVLDDPGAEGGAGAFFRCASSSISPWPPAAPAAGPASAVVTTHEWEKTLYPLFSHVLTSILFVQRASRHRMLLLVNDVFPPRPFRAALHRVLLDYLGMGGVRLVHGGVFEGLYHLMQLLPPSLPAPGRPTAHMLVDIGTHEARVLVSVAGSSALADTHQATAAGYQTFLCQVSKNYQAINQRADDTSEQSELVESESPVLTLEDANAIVQSWIALSSTSSLPHDSTTISVDLPSLENQQQGQSQTSTQTVVELPIQPLLKAFHHIYLDYANPASLIFSMLTCALACPIDHRRGVLKNVLLLGGGAVALRHSGCATPGRPATGLGPQLETAAREACRTPADEAAEQDQGEEKKEDGALPISAMSRRRFHSLRGVVVGRVTREGDGREGMHARYPDPFAADMAAWIGGSIMGTLGGHYQKKM